MPASLTNHHFVRRCNEDTVTIVDVTEKNNPLEVSRTTYNGVKYTHQGWLSADHNTFFFGDELDELNAGINTRTYVMNVASLSTPVIVGTYDSTKAAIDHNQYTHQDHLYQANYRAGLQVLKIGNDISNNADLTEVAFFDVYPESDNALFTGAWSTYPYFPSGNVIVSSIDRGLFVLKVNIDTTVTCDDVPSRITCSGGICSAS